MSEADDVRPRLYRPAPGSEGVRLAMHISGTAAMRRYASGATNSSVPTRDVIVVSSTAVTQVRVLEHVNNRALLPTNRDAESPPRGYTCILQARQHAAEEGQRYGVRQQPNSVCHRVLVRPRRVPHRSRHPGRPSGHPTLGPAPVAPAERPRRLDAPAPQSLHHSRTRRSPSCAPSSLDPGTRSRLHHIPARQLE